MRSNAEKKSGPFFAFSTESFIEVGESISLRNSDFTAPKQANISAEHYSEVPVIASPFDLGDNTEHFIIC